MTAILLTGMSGMGKSTALAALADRGHDCVDTDEGDWIEQVDGEPLWRIEAVDALLGHPRTGTLFVQGAVANQGELYDRFAAVVLLAAPTSVILHRLATRTTNDFGKTAEERARILDDLEHVEPLLRRGATHVIDTDRPLADVVAELERIARAAAAAASA
ncbi:AAA family ATPase [Microcella daejeonensis]|uniref:AAA family ATPase n=1 Tax=Microcella daejeonensis TaxID=2994971 RepID=A0A9E8S8A7_9MICO|nr:AAA family ATPase [Microcella daejeonensis]WAB80734.1 AAA family ATPase [Microcella daejeonensis]